MSKELNELIQEAEQLSTEEQLRLIAHLAQSLSTRSPNPQEHAQPPKTGKSILQIAEEFTQGLSQEELSKLPTDGAEQHDHYIYGTPKTIS